MSMVKMLTRQMFTDFVTECDAGRNGKNASAMIADEVKVDGHLSGVSA